MTIHHSHVKKATKMGFTMNEADGKILAFWPKKNWGITFDDSKTAIEQMGRLINAANSDPHLNYVSALKLIGREPPLDEPTVAVEIVGPDGEELDDEDYEEKQAAGVRPNEEAEDGGDRSVVKGKYRAKYAELGHPKHCGDWLAILLNNTCGGKTKTDLELFESICMMNGIDLAKYSRTSHGWQGRLRMTGRNMLSKVVWKQGGLRVPASVNAEQWFPAPADWVAEQRFTKAAVNKGTGQNVAA